MADKPSLIKRMMRPLVNNEVDTSVSGWYPELKPRAYDADLADVFRAARAVIDDRERWDEVSQDADSGEIHAEVTTKRAGFVDDLHVTVGRRDGQTVVNVRSASRVGKGDFGQNARTVREFLDRLDRKVRRLQRHSD